MKVALVHEYLIKQGGSENVVEALKGLFPEAPIYTSYFGAATMPERWRRYDVRPSFCKNCPWGAAPATRGGCSMCCPDARRLRELRPARI